MKAQTRRVVLVALALALISAALWVKSRFDNDMQRARAQAARGSVVVPTPCGPIEYQEAGAGVPLLAVHGSGGGHDQGMAFAAGLAPVSLRAAGLRSDTAVGKHLSPSPLESIQTPTLVISARDDRYGTYASAQYTANRIAGAKFVGFDAGGHTWVGHDDEVRAAIVALLVQ